MKVTPVHQARRPAYPSRQEAGAALFRIVPKRWVIKGTVFGALAAAGAAVLYPLFVPAKYSGARPHHLVTEGDAMIEMLKETDKSGIDLETEALTLDIHLPSGKRPKDAIDFYDSQKRIGFEFVSSRDCREVDGEDTDLTPVELANAINRSLESSPLRGRILVYPLPQSKELPFDVQEKQLRAAIRGFIGRLKLRGASK